MQEFQMLYDLVKETRNEVRAINAKLDAHIVTTASQLVEAKAPQTFLANLKVVALWLGAIGGFVTPVVLFLSTVRH